MQELCDFEAGRMEQKGFRYVDHVRLGFEMLDRYPFAEALARFTTGLKLLAAKAGSPDLYNETITVAFLAVIGERLASNQTTWSEFIHANPDLLDKHLLEAWYDPVRLNSDISRRTFCLPNPRRDAVPRKSEVLGR